jgi:hypothetical protein
MHFENTRFTEKNYLFEGVIYQYFEGMYYERYHGRNITISNNCAWAEREKKIIKQTF